MLAGSHPEFVVSMRGKRLLKIDHYTYYPTSEGPKIRWRCSSHHGCKATVHTYDDCIISFNGGHGHLPRYKRQSRLYASQIQDTIPKKIKS